MIFYLNQRTRVFMPGLLLPAQQLLDKAITITPINFELIQGRRTREEQFADWRASHNLDGSPIPGAKWKTDDNGTPIGQLTPEGAPGTGIGPHQGGRAFDFAVLVNGELVWEPISLYQDLVNVFKQAASLLNIHIICGIDWAAPKTDPDHIQLDKRFYPDMEPSA